MLFILIIEMLLKQNFLKHKNNFLKYIYLLNNCEGGKKKLYVLYSGLNFLGMAFSTNVKKIVKMSLTFLYKKHILSKSQHFSVNTAFHDSIIHHWQGLRNNETATSI